MSELESLRGFMDLLPFATVDQSNGNRGLFCRAFWHASKLCDEMSFPESESTQKRTHTALAELRRVVRNKNVRAFESWKEKSREALSLPI
jgi:hypothetical protein